MGFLSILNDENGQCSTTRVALLLVMVCIVTEWQYAIWSGTVWTPDTWKMTLLGGLLGTKLIQKPFEKKNVE